MAFNITADGVSQSVGSVTFNGSWTGADVSCGGSEPAVQFNWGYSAFSFYTPIHNGNGPSGSWNAGEAVNKDRAAKYRGVGDDCSATKQSNNIQFKTYADAAYFPSGLTPGTPTQTTVTVSGLVVPNTNESTGDVTLEYRVQGTITWIQHSTVAVGLSGTGSLAVAGELTGLIPGTAYEARYKITRNTSNDTVAYSATGTFTTQASTPVTVSAQVMNMTLEMLAPSQIGADSLEVNALVMDMELEMLTPSIVTESAEKIIQLNIQTADEVERSIVMD